MKGTLTPRQQEVYTFIKTYIAKHKVSPTFRQIGEDTHVTTGSIRTHVEKLQQKGYVQQIPYKHQGLLIIK